MSNQIKKLLSNGFPRYLAFIVSLGLILWAWGCPPRCKSISNPAIKVTRPELQIELDTILATAELRFEELETQERVRDILLKNALIAAESGTVNPFGIITAALAVYGIGSAVKSGAKTLSTGKPPPTA